jgi:diacylglycerol kinase (ATP)
MSKKNKSKRALLIANPGSGKAAGRTALIEQVTHYLQDRGVKLDVAIAKPKEKAIPIARKAVKDGYKVVIALGGDDTVEAIIRGLAGSKTKLGIIPAGTANNLAKSMGIPADPQEACALIASGQTRKLDMGQIQVKKGKKFPFFEMASVGILSALYPDAEDIRKGELSKIKDAVVTFLNHKTKPKITLTMDGGSEIAVETMLVTITNVPLIGLNFLVAPDARLDDGLMDISLYPDFSKSELVAYFGKVMNEGQTRDGTIQRYRTSQLKIKASPKLVVMADGTMLGKGTVRIKVLPGVLRVIAPPAGAGAEKPPTEASKDLPAPVSQAVVPPGPNKNEAAPVPEIGTKKTTEFAH